jgi:hypothetical protein
MATRRPSGVGPVSNARHDGGERLVIPDADGRMS